MCTNCVWWFESVKWCTSEQMKTCFDLQWHCECKSLSFRICSIKGCCMPVFCFVSSAAHGNLQTWPFLPFYLCCSCLWVCLFPTRVLPPWRPSPMAAHSSTQSSTHQKAARIPISSRASPRWERWHFVQTWNSPFHMCSNLLCALCLHVCSWRLSIPTLRFILVNPTCGLLISIIPPK